MGGIFTFQVRVIATNPGLVDGNWVDFRIRAQAGANMTATNYLGDDGIIYGGSIGENWNGVPGINPGYIFNQWNTNIRLTVQSAAGVPQLNIMKSISNINLGGLPISAAIPGATMVYMISYSNTGTSPGMDALICDKIPANTKYFTNYLLAPTVGWTPQYAFTADPDQSYNSSEYSNTYTLKTNVIWVRWRKLNVPVGEKGSIMYKVIIK